MTQPIGITTPPQPTPARWNPIAVAALVSVVVFWPLGIILGHIARHDTTSTGERGRALATAAIVIGYFWLAFLVLLVLTQNAR